MDALVLDVTGEGAPVTFTPQQPGPGRWEQPLAEAGLDAPDHRPLPDDLAATLSELVELHRIVTHHGSRADQRASGVLNGVRAGERVRVSRADVGRYNAAVRAYGFEIARRLGLPNDVDLTDWQELRSRYT